MTDIKTHLGYARAWVRLCLEKKLLFQHLTTLLSEESLLRQVSCTWGKKSPFSNSPHICAMQDLVQTLRVPAL